MSPQLLPMDVQGAASSSVSQVLAERSARQSSSMEQMVEEMVPGVYHEFLDVFNRTCSE